MYKWLCVWLNLNTNEYYFRFIRNYNDEYYVNYINQFNHKLVIYNEIPFYIEKVSFFNGRLKKRTIRKLISFLEKI